MALSISSSNKNQLVQKLQAIQDELASTDPEFIKAWLKIYPIQLDEATFNWLVKTLSGPRL
jgi:hypothetical protein